MTSAEKFGRSTLVNVKICYNAVIIKLHNSKRSSKNGVDSVTHCHKIKCIKLSALLEHSLVKTGKH